MHQGYGFVEYMTEDDAEYAAKYALCPLSPSHLAYLNKHRVLNMVKLFGRPLRVNKSSSSRKGEEITPYSANLFVGNLDGSVDEKMLYDTFSAFGVIVQVYFDLYATNYFFNLFIIQDAQNPTRNRQWRVQGLWLCCL